jgi:hypothetical protein
MDTKEYIKHVMNENNKRLKEYVQQQVAAGSAEVTELRQQNQLLQQELDTLSQLLDSINRETV